MSHSTADVPVVPRQQEATMNLKHAASPVGDSQHRNRVSFDQPGMEPVQKSPSVTSDPHSLAESTKSGISVKKLKTKIKKRLHRHHHHRDENGPGTVDYDDAEEDEEDDEEDEATAGVDDGMTPAQTYAQEQATKTVASQSSARRSSTSEHRFHSGSVSSVHSMTSPLTKAESVGVGARRSMDSHRPHARSLSTPPSQSDWKRLAEFHNLFAEISDDEHLVSDYSSAWAKDILRHGRLYVGAAHLAFSCTIIGLKASLVVAYTDIVLIEKSVTARVIPNAITITLKSGESHLFSSFVTRDASYDIIMDCWRIANPSAYNSMLASSNAALSTPVDSPSAHALAIDTSLGSSARSTPAAMETSTAPVSAMSHARDRSISSSTPKTPHQPTEGSVPHYKEVSLDTQFPCEPSKLYDLLYCNEDFLRTFWTSQKLTDCKIGPWQPGGRGKRKRDTSYVKPLSGGVGPSSTTCYIEDHEMKADPDKAYEILTVTKTPDVPSGHSFHIETLTCLSWAAAPEGGCHMHVTTECIWSGRSLIKSIVTSASINGQKDFNNALAKALRAYMRTQHKEINDADTSPTEVIDEVGADAAAEKNSQRPAAASQASPFASQTLPSFWSDPFCTAHLPVAIMAISNLVLMLFILFMWLFGGSGQSRVVMSAGREVEAIERLQALEASWSQFKKCVDSLAKS